ncbi:allophanate hydrolase-related protein [Microlunatus antarcticus]
MTALFCNGEGMRGGAVHENLSGELFLGEATTAPRYRFYSVRDEFPGVLDVGTDTGGAVRGELYDVELRTLLDRFLPGEPSELELGVVELDDGRAVLGMVLRPEERDRHRDITEHGGWRAYRASL